MEKESSLESVLLNPPETTRPPPIELPVRENYASSPSYLWNLARTIAKFYWKGIKQINVNRKILTERTARTPKDDRPSILSPWKIPETFSRADWILLWRVRHDLMRLPLFGLMCCVIGELTVLVVLLFPAIVPLTCRLPNQKRKTIERSEARRADIFQQIEEAYPEGVLSSSMTQGAARSLVLRNLYLTGNIWETVKAAPPGAWALKGSAHIKYLIGDDKNLLKDGAPSGLIKDELRNACIERGLNVSNKSESDLRTLLGDWLRLTNAESDSERRRRMLTLLLTK